MSYQLNFGSTYYNQPYEKEIVMTQNIRTNVPFYEPPKIQA